VDIFGIIAGQLPGALIGVVVTYISTSLLNKKNVRALKALKDKLARRTEPPNISLSKPEPAKGLIVLVSREQAMTRAVDYHRSALQRCWIIHSDAEESHNAAVGLKEAEHDKQNGIKVDLLQVEDVYSVQEVRDKVQGIFSQLPAGMSDTDVVSDFTGMTALSSVGMTLACLSPNRRLQYVPELPGRHSGEPKEIKLSWEDLPTPDTK